MVAAAHTPTFFICKRAAAAPLFGLLDFNFHSTLRDSACLLMTAWVGANG
jgi:hypothetical protein